MQGRNTCVKGQRQKERKTILILNGKIFLGMSKDSQKQPGAASYTEQQYISLVTSFLTKQTKQKLQQRHHARREVI